MGGATGGEIGMSNSNASEELPVYAIRTREYARRDINAATVRLAELVSDAAALAWSQELKEAIGSLATLPRRCPRVPEPFHGEVRQMLYRRSHSSLVYRVLFRITGEEADSPEPPTIVIIHVRHGAARPLTRAQIRQIEADE